jgi:hypothetical protein
MIGPLLALLLVLVSLSPSTWSRAEPSCEPGQQPTFHSDFATVKVELGAVMGEPIECERTDPRNGEVLQRTTTGLAYRPKDADTPIFTNGHDHWALTPTGLVHWTG